MQPSSQRTLLFALVLASGVISAIGLVVLGAEGLFMGVGFLLAAGLVWFFLASLERWRGEPAAREPDPWDGGPAPVTAGGDPSHEASPSAVDDARARTRRRWIAGGAALAVAVQALIPLRYYLGDDAYDERFSWRMFSAVRMQECRISASETTNGAAQRVRLMETIHVGWITTLRRNREAVMERYLEWRCEHEGVQRARLENECRTPDGDPVPTIVREIDCASGAITREGGTP